MFNPQSLNRYSYVLNNPLRYTDPTGHKETACASQYDPECSAVNGGSTGNTNGGGSSGNGQNNNNNNHGNNEGGDDVASSVVIPGGPCVGTPGNAGNFYGGYCAGGGGLLQGGINSVGGDAGDCAGYACSFTGGSVPISYNASVDILLYDNLMVVILHENYWIPDHDLPLMENATFGGSTLISQLSNGHQVETNLGFFTPGNAAHPERLIHRDTQIKYWGKSNFPTQLAVRLIYGAEYRKASTIYYQLPYQAP